MKILGTIKDTEAIVPVPNKQFVSSSEKSKWNNNSKTIADLTKRVIYLEGIIETLINEHLVVHPIEDHNGKTLSEIQGAIVYAFKE